MLCERCGQHDSLVYLTTMIRGIVSREYLCAECAQHAPVVAESVVAFLQKTRSSSEIIQGIVSRDTRFATAAYEFVQAAMDLAMDMKEHADDRERASDGISATELLEVFRTLALLRLGNSAKRSLNAWGIERCEDVGEIVFRFCEAGYFGRRPTDCREDFQRGYDFDEAFPDS